MHVQWFAHLPGVQLETEMSSHDILEGKVKHLSFFEWCELDPSFPDSEASYTASQPVFYIGSASLEGDLKAVLKQVSHRLNRFYRALLLDSRVPWLPDPQLSVHYVRVNLPTGVATYRLVGPFEREWIVYGNRIVYSFDEAAMRAIGAVYELLPEQENGSMLPAIEAGIETLVRTAKPDTWWDQRGIQLINDFIHCTGALEKLLVPETNGTEEIKVAPAFGEHAAVLVNKSRDGLTELAGSYSGLYRLRSNLVHGYMTVADLSDTDQQVLRLGRILLREILIKSLALNKYTNGQQQGDQAAHKNGQVSLAYMLKKAYEDDAFHQSIHSRLREVEALV